MLTAVALAVIPASALAAQTITVANTADDVGGGACTLSDALTVADAVSNPALPDIDSAMADCASSTVGSGAPTTIALQSGATYSLTVIDNFWFGPDGLPPISSPVTIQGNGATITRAASASPFRLFYVSGGLSGIPSGSLTLQNLTLSGGLAKGGDSFSGGGGAGMGGAIFNQGALVLQRTTVTGNAATGGAGDGDAGAGGGGIGQDAPRPPAKGTGGGFGGPAPGAAMGPGGTAEITVEGRAGGGGGFGSTDAAQHIVNICSQCGGGGLGGFGGTGLEFPVAVGDGGQGGFARSPNPFGPGGAGGQGGTFAAGGGGVGGGGAIGDYGAGSGGFGGGGAAATSLDFGGGGFGGGGGGSAGAGGGRAGYGAGTGGQSGIDEVGGGGAGMGGAVFTLFGTVTIDDSTLAGNSAAGGTTLAPATDGDGLGGAVFSVDGAVTISGSTVAANAATGGALTAGGLYSVAFGNTITTGAATTASMNITGSILSGNTTTDLDADLINGRSQNTSQVTLTGANVVGASATSNGAQLTGTAITTDPQLGALADNGGLLQTMRPGTTGSARGAQPSCSGTDELGNPRTGPSCDLGALQVATAPPTVSTTAPTAVTAGFATLNRTIDPSGSASSYRIELSTSDAFTTITKIAGGTLGAGSASVAVHGAATGLEPQTQYSYRVIATNSAGTATSTPIGHFTTAGGPVATTTGPTEVTQTSATLTGTVNPNGLDTTYAFELSESPSFTTDVNLPVSTDAGSGSTPLVVSRAAGDLTAGTTYYYRLRATNAAGTSTSNPVSFMTAATPPPPSGGEGAGGANGGGGGGAGGGGASGGGGNGSTVIKPSLIRRGAVKVAVAGSRVTVNDGRALRCGSGPARCVTRLVVTAPRKAAKPKAGRRPKRPAKTRRVTIARATIAVSPGSTRPLTFRLNATGRSLLRQRRVVLASVQIMVAYGGSRTVSFNHRLTLRRPVRRVRASAAIGR
jgi:hypothetical protein